MQAVCKHIQIDYDERMLDPQTMGGEPPNPKHLDQWRTQISEEDIRLIEARLDGLMQARGYEDASLGSMDIGETKAKWLQITDRMARASHRAQTYHHIAVITQYGRGPSGITNHSKANRPAN